MTETKTNNSLKVGGGVFAGGIAAEVGVKFSVKGCNIELGANGTFELAVGAQLGFEANINFCKTISAIFEGLEHGKRIPCGDEDEDDDLPYVFGTMNHPMKIYNPGAKWCDGCRKCGKFFGEAYAAILEGLKSSGNSADWIFSKALSKDLEYMKNGWWCQKTVE